VRLHFCFISWNNTHKSSLQISDLLWFELLQSRTNWH